jgi:hypothetical protein
MEGSAASRRSEMGRSNRWGARQEIEEAVRLE